MGGKLYRVKRRGNGGLHTVFVNARGLEEACPVTRIIGPGTPRSYDDKKRACAEAAIRARTIRQAGQAWNDKVTWPFELAHVATKEKVKGKKTLEMTEKEAAQRNNTLKDLGFYWRRAPY